MIYIVAGMHRSGTSMLAGLLHNSGISMGTQFRMPLPENPKGFFEEESFRLENDRVLRQSGYTVERWEASFRGISVTAADCARARAVLARLNQSPNKWGWKDPRTCLTLRLWLTALKDLGLLESTKVIVITRDVQAVARSLCNRGNVECLNQGAALCKMYNRELTEALSGKSMTPPVCYVQYERLIQGLDVDRL